MTRTKDATGSKASHPQPTNLQSRRGTAGVGQKLEEGKSIPRDIFTPRNLSQDEFCRAETKIPASKVGLGGVLFIMKPQHYFNSKTPLEQKISLAGYRKRYPEIAKKFKKEGDSSEEEGSTALCKSMKKLAIYKETEEEEEDEVKKGKKKISKAANVEQGLMRQSFKKLVAVEKVAYESGQSITVLVDGKTKSFKKSSSAVRKAGVRNWKSPEASEELHNGLLRSLFSWSLPMSTRWNEIEERVARWGGGATEKGVVKAEEIAEQLNVSVEEFKRLHFHKDLKKIVEVLKNHVCHVSLPWLSTLSAVSELQDGDVVRATSCATESHGTYLHSEIIDKHVCYISRNEEANPNSGQRSSFSTKSELFRKQIHETLSFGKDTVNSEIASCFNKTISSFNADWNIIQITGLLQSKNRFGMDLYTKPKIPQLLLSAMAHIPNESERSCFTTFCPDPPVYEGSLMRHGLMETFQKILDRNLVISDDSVVISRKNYWEERSKHNQAMMGVIHAMEEDWIGPWNFLLPGHTTHRDIQEKIITKIITPSAKKYKLSSSQKLILYKLTENYKYLHRSTANSLETIVAFIFKVSETGLNALCKKIRDIGLEVPLEDRHSTILIIDQDLEIYPWESMNCLINTDVSRMPSLNLIRSNYNLVSSLRTSYPDIVDSNSCTFVLNPDGTLPNVQKRLEKYFLDHKEWVPVIGRPPATKEVQECLENQHVFLYNGHGAGSSFYPDHAIQKLLCQAVPLLMGCSSAQTHYAIPRVYGSSTIHSYFLAGCPSAVGYLWEITDAECDRITADLIERWLPDKSVRPPTITFFDHNAKREREKCLSTAMRLSRKAATQYLTQCAIVCYGLPINTQN